MCACFGAGAPFVEVPHDSESSTGGSASSLPEDAVLNPVKRPEPGDQAAQHAAHAAGILVSVHMHYSCSDVGLGFLHFSIYHA